MRDKPPSWSHAHAVGDLGVTADGQITDLRPRDFWAQVQELLPESAASGAAAYRVRQILDGRIAEDGTVEATGYELTAYEVGGSRDVPIGAIVRIHRSHFGAAWCFACGCPVTDAGSGTSGDSGSGESGSGDSGSGESGGGESGSGDASDIVPCSDCLARLCVTRDPYTGAITGIYYQTAGGLVAVPDCSGGYDYDYGYDSGSSPPPPPPPPCSGTTTYDTAGTYTFTAPCDGTYLVECWGGGGGGAGGSGASGGGGGAGGSYARSVLTLTAGSYTVVVGAGGAGGPVGGAGSAGGASSFGASLVVAAGGLAGSGAIGGAAGSGSVGSTVFAGGHGGSSAGHPRGGGGGGGSAHPLGSGGGGGNGGNPAGGSGGTSGAEGGPGGIGGAVGAAGSPGTAPGGGGGGGGSMSPGPGTTGGSGQRGRVRITWPAP